MRPGAIETSVLVRSFQNAHQLASRPVRVGVPHQSGKRALHQNRPISRLSLPEIFVPTHTFPPPNHLRAAEIVLNYCPFRARVAELADALDSGSSE